MNSLYNILITILFCLSISVLLTAADSDGDRPNLANSTQTNSTDSDETYFAPTRAQACGSCPTTRDLGFIVGGSEAPRHGYPWAAAVYMNGRFICGGSVIKEKYILCAAHCISQSNGIIPAKNFRIKLGAHNLLNSGQFYDVAEHYVHENYNPNYQLNDIAIFKLATPINFKDAKNIGPVCLPPRDIDSRKLVGRNAIVLGWGTTTPGGRPADTLRHVPVPIIDNKECANSYGSTMITSKHICAAYKKGGKDSCQGDSGGPLVYSIERACHQIGIVSWGKGCAEAGYPGVYTRVTEYLDWINKKTAN